MKHIEDLLQSFYSLFSHIPKRHIEFLKFVDLMKTKGNKILWNVKTCWINMLNMTKQVMSMYMPLVAKMAKDSPSFMVARVNFELLCNVNLLISLSYLLPMLETIHALIKFAQKQN